MRYVKDYALGWLLFLMFAGSFFGQWYTHTEDSTKFWNAVFENWQSEFLQIFVFIVASKYLIFRHSPQSRDSEDEGNAMIKKILDILQRRT